jgi:hypothetical protein
MLDLERSSDANEAILPNVQTRVNQTTADLIQEVIVRDHLLLTLLSPYVFNRLAPLQVPLQHSTRNMMI